MDSKLAVTENDKIVVIDHASALVFQGVHFAQREGKQKALGRIATYLQRARTKPPNDNPILETDQKEQVRPVIHIKVKIRRNQLIKLVNKFKLYRFCLTITGKHVEQLALHFNFIK